MMIKMKLVNIRIKVYKHASFISCSAGGDTQKCRQQLIDITNVPILTAELNLIEPLKQSRNEVDGKILEFCTKLM